jgi:hypothetical protein
MESCKYLAKKVLKILYIDLLELLTKPLTSGSAVMSISFFSYWKNLQVLFSLEHETLQLYFTFFSKHLSFRFCRNFVKAASLVAVRFKSGQGWGSGADT